MILFVDRLALRTSVCWIQKCTSDEHEVLRLWRLSYNMLKNLTD